MPGAGRVRTALPRLAAVLLPRGLPRGAAANALTAAARQVGEYLRPLLAAADAAVAAAAARAALAAAAHADGALAPLAAAAAAALAELWDAPARAPARGQLLDALARALPVLEARPADACRAGIFLVLVTAWARLRAVWAAGGSEEAGSRNAWEVMTRASLSGHLPFAVAARCSRRAARGRPRGHVRRRVQPGRRMGTSEQSAHALLTRPTDSCRRSYRRCGGDGCGSRADGAAARAQPSARLALLRQLPALAAALPGAGERVGALAHVWAAAVGLDLDGRRAGRLRDRTAPAAELRALLSDPFLAAVISGAPDGARPAQTLTPNPKPRAARARRCRRPERLLALARARRRRARRARARRPAGAARPDPSVDILVRLCRDRQAAARAWRATPSTRPSARSWSPRCWRRWRRTRARPPRASQRPRPRRRRRRPTALWSRSWRRRSRARRPRRRPPSWPSGSAAPRSRCRRAPRWPPFSRPALRAPAVGAASDSSTAPGWRRRAPRARAQGTNACLGWEREPEGGTYACTAVTDAWLALLALAFHAARLLLSAPTPAGAAGAEAPAAGALDAPGAAAAAGRRASAEPPAELGRTGAAVASYAAALQELLAQLLLHWKVRPLGAPGAAGRPPAVRCLPSSGWALPCFPAQLPGAPCCRGGLSPLSQGAESARARGRRR